MNIRSMDRATLLTLGAIAALANQPARAQDAQAPATRAEELETVTVTGSRIRRNDYVSDSPVVTVSADALTESGSTATEHLLNTLPQFVPSVTTTSNNPANGGQANIDLRGLGTLRNLVLLDGRRLPPSNSNGTVDVNIIPSALIENIEVVTGGASAVYGSDAIAGVVNFKLKRDFQGAAIESGYGQTDHSDGTEWSSSLTLGSNFGEGRGNAVFSFQYTEREALYQDARPFSEVTLDVRRDGNTPQGSPTILEGRYTRDQENSFTQAAINSVFGRYGAAAGSVPFAQNIGFNPDGTLFTIGTTAPGSVVNYRGDTSDPGFSDSAFTWNFAPSNAMILPVKRWSLTGLGDFNVSEDTQAYVQTFFTTYDTTATLAPVPAARGITIPVTNPFISTDLAELLASRPDPDAAFTYSQRMLGVGPREARDEYDVYQMLGGLRGKLAGDYSWDVYVSRSHMANTTSFNNDVLQSRLQELLNAADGGVSKCAGGYNPFTGPAGMSPACAGYVRGYLTNRTQLETTMAEATLGGRAFALGERDAQFSVGASWREEGYDFRPDQVISRGESVGFNGQSPLRGSFNVTDLFGELYLPVLEGKRLVQDLGFTLGARLSDHSLAGTNNAYKLEGNWHMLDSLRWRASFQRAVRAPSISELFSPLNQNFPTLLEDPCSVDSAARNHGPNADVAAGGSGAARALCIAQGIRADSVDSFSYGGQIETLGGGNPDLSEEKADTLTLGAVFDFENFRASVDWYDIKLSDAIFSIPAGEILLLCFGYSGNNPGLDANDPACRSVDRITQINGSPANGVPSVPSQGTANVSSLRTSGVDVQFDWNLGLGDAGKLDLNLLANWLQKWEIAYVPGLPLIDYKGTVGDTIGSALPDYKLLLNARWHLRTFGAGLRVQYLPAMDNKYASYDPFTTVGTPAITYLDANVSWQPAELLELRLGVENLTDETPPLYTASVQMNTDPSTFDVLGRRYFFRANLKF
jgi:iron complex outermembrane recepter protein